MSGREAKVARTRNLQRKLAASGRARLQLLESGGRIKPSPVPSATQAPKPRAHAVGGQSSASKAHGGAPSARMEKPVQTEELRAAAPREGKRAHAAADAVKASAPRPAVGSASKRVRRVVRPAATTLRSSVPASDVAPVPETATSAAARARELERGFARVRVLVLALGAMLTCLYLRLYISTEHLRYLLNDGTHLYRHAVGRVELSPVPVEVAGLALLKVVLVGELVLYVLRRAIAKTFSLVERFAVAVLTLASLLFPVLRNDGGEWGAFTRWCDEAGGLPLLWIACVLVACITFSLTLWVAHAPGSQQDHVFVLMVTFAFWVFVWVWTAGSISVVAESVLAALLFVWTFALTLWVGRRPIAWHGHVIRRFEAALSAQLILFVYLGLYWTPIVRFVNETGSLSLAYVVWLLAMLAAATLFAWVVLGGAVGSPREQRAVLCAALALCVGVLHASATEWVAQHAVGVGAAWVALVCVAVWWTALDAAPQPMLAGRQQPQRDMWAARGAEAAAKSNKTPDVLGGALGGMLGGPFVAAAGDTLRILNVVRGVMDDAVLFSVCVLLGFGVQLSVWKAAHAVA